MAIVFQFPILFITLLLSSSGSIVPCCSLQLEMRQNGGDSLPVGRRNALGQTLRSICSPSMTFWAASLAITTCPDPALATMNTPHKRPYNERVDSGPYLVQADWSASLSPRLSSVSSTLAMNMIADSDVRSVWLGEHHNSLPDHELQVSIIAGLLQRWRKGSKAGENKQARLVVVGLEAVQQQFQPVLDDYIAGRVNAKGLFQGTEWSKRWVWPFERYLPVFEFCRKEGIPLLALSIDSETLEKCEIDGISALSKDEVKKFMPDVNGFNGFTGTTAFREYMAYDIVTGYNMHQSMGILGNTVTGQKLDSPMSFRNFYASRILRDEAMATAAARWSRDGPGGKEGKLVGLVGSGHVKFSCGVPARTSRLLRESPERAKAVMLNPTVVDTSRAAADVQDNQLTLQIRFAKIKGRDAFDDPVVSRSVTGGDATADVLAAVEMRQVSPGNGGVLPVADLFWYS